ncbi:5'-nucleotidase C-terminal domain-containing protein [Pleionea sediminis]|uniref:5'-nucleotidase C-terminal domain-containing protein n=1 Tax=Pleionea sediminis TaxID=2569479 RepID=UPI00118559DC|nr:5'-nucleotidase [Pleionea sediminis]
MKLLNLFLFTFSLLLITSCDEGNQLLSPREEINEEVIGVTNVDLDANRNVVRTGEALIGNMVSDGMFEFLANNGYSLDFSLVNGGNIRYNSATNPDGIYDSGELTRQDASDIFPFNNTIYLVTVTGEQLKEIFERGVAFAPEPFGGFLQVSSHIQVFVDLTQQPQELDETTEPPTIVTEGQRVIQILINGNAVLSNENYTFSFNSFGADGGDGFVTMQALPAAQKVDTELFEDDVLAGYIQSVSVVAPVIESRIVISNE